MNTANFLSKERRFSVPGRRRKDMKRLLLCLLIIITLFTALCVSAEAPASFDAPAADADTQSQETKEQGGSAVFGIMVLKSKPADPVPAPVHLSIGLDFSAFDPSSENENALVSYDAENARVEADLSRVMLRDNPGSVQISLSSDGDYTYDTLDAFQAENSAESDPVRLENGRLLMRGDGVLQASDGFNTLELEVTGYNALFTQTVSLDGARVDIAEGFVPAGASLNYAELDEDAVSALVRQYLADPAPQLSPVKSVKKAPAALMKAPAAAKSGAKRGAAVSPASGSLTGYTAFDLSLQGNGGEITDDGEYRVSVPLPEAAQHLTPQGARQKDITYTVYHLHGGDVEQLDAREEDGIVSFTTANFSTFILQYTVDFEYVDPETGELYAYTLGGGDGVLLSALLSSMGIEADLTDSDALFTDPELITLEPVENDDGDLSDWLLTSVYPFDSEEALTVTLANGAEIILRVTDEQIVTYYIDAQGDTYEITVSYDRSLRIPKNAALQVREISAASAEYAAYIAQCAEKIGVKTEKIKFARAFDIKIVDGNDPETEYEPDGEVNVSIRLVGSGLDAYDNVDVLHFAESGDPADGSAAVYEMNSAVTGETVAFSTDSFSVYVVAGYTLETLVEASDGNTYRITVEYNGNAGIPMTGTALSAREIAPGSSDYNFYLNETIKALDTDSDHLSLSRAFDIKIVDEADPAHIYDPQSDVKVSITLVGETLAEYADVHVLHFDGDSDVSEMSTTVTAADTIEFTTDSFSVYAVGGNVHVRRYEFYSYNEYHEFVEYYISTGTEEPTFTQIIRSGETLVSPMTPIDPQDDEATFAGWYESAHGADRNNVQYLQEPYEFGVQTFTDDETICLYAKFSHYTYVIFHDQYVDGVGFPVAYTHRVDLEGMVTDRYVEINKYSVTYNAPPGEDDNAMWFVGWSDVPISDPTYQVNDRGNAPTPVTQTPMGDSQTPMYYVSGTTHLYPIFKTVKWLSFYSGSSGSGATYFADEHFFDGIGPDHLPGTSDSANYKAMKRDGGYTFQGWWVGDGITLYNYPSNNSLSRLNGDVDTASLIPPDAVKIAGADGQLIPDAKWPATNPVIEVKSETVNESTHYYIQLNGDTSVKLYAVWDAPTTAKISVVAVKQKEMPATALAALRPQEQYEYLGKWEEDLTIDSYINVQDWEVLTSAFYKYLHLEDVDCYNAAFNASLASGDTTPLAAKTYTCNISMLESDYYRATETDRPQVKADGSTVIYVRYDWSTEPTPSSDKYELHFVDWLLSNDPDNKSDDLLASSLTLATGTMLEYTGDDKLSYGQTIAPKVPRFIHTQEVDGQQVTVEEYTPISGNPAKWEFIGWYADADLKTRAFFEYSTEYQNYTGSKALFTTMPATDITFYAGWKLRWYIVTIDPNYGALYTRDNNNVFKGDGSTWFWAAYGTQIQEYIATTRNYIEDDTGTWYYVNHAGDGKGGNNGWPDRYTYYTQNLSEATEFQTFIPVTSTTDSYRYSGWYQVDENGNEAATRYDFNGDYVKGNTTLRLRWKRIGTFFLAYDLTQTMPNGETITGTMDQERDNEALYMDLDAQPYSDDAEVVLNRTVIPPDGYEFVGWRIHRDTSGTIYRPSQAFHLLSEFSTMMQGRRTILLDAVYEQVPMATVVYHANGGTALSESAISNRAKWDDYFGHYPSDSTVSTSLKTVATHTWDLSGSDPTITFGSIVNNAQIVLSDGTWLTAPAGTTFAGWCENPEGKYDPAQKDTYPLLQGGGDSYAVGVNQGGTPEVHLHAIWQVNVTYHLNETSANANFGGTWDTSTYTLSADNTYYTSKSYIGSILSWPPYDPVYTGNEGKSFLGWATENSATAPNYNFTQPVTGALDLYAVWGQARTLAVKLLDTSDYPTVVYAPWTIDGDETITLTAERQTPRNLAPAIPLDPTYSSYGCAFAVVEKVGVGIQYVQEDPIEYIYYSPRDGKVHLVYGAQYQTVHGALPAQTDVTLDETNEVLYILYYKVKTPQIKYMLMETSGFLSEITNMNSAAPTSLAAVGAVAPNVVTTISASYNPMAWLADPIRYNERTALSPAGTNLKTKSKGEITHYNFNIGAANAENSSQLDHKTQAYTGTETGNDARPDLKIKNTWRGLRFSQDGGATWFDAGDPNPCLYVVYYTETPTIITLYNRTVGLAADMETKFTYDYWIEEVFLAPYQDNSGTYNLGDSRLIFTTRSNSSSKLLGNGETFSAFTTTNSTHTYRVTFALTPTQETAGFALTLPTLSTVPGSTADPEITQPNWVGDTSATGYYSTTADVGKTFSYTVKPNDGYCGKSAVIIFTNTREYVYADLHIAKAELTGDIKHAHDWRVSKSDQAASTVWDENNKYTVKIPLDETVNLFDNHTYDKITNNNVDTYYVPGALIYGHDMHTEALHGSPTPPANADIVTLDEDAPLSCYRLAYEKVNPSDASSTVYNIYMKDERDDYRYPLTDMADQFAHKINGSTHNNLDPNDIIQFYRLYYLFYPAVRVYYVMEDTAGNLTPIVGKIDNNNNEIITYNGEQATLNSYDGMQATLNSQNVTQGQKVGIWERYLEICQDVGRDQNGNPYFNVPPMLDRWDTTDQETHKLDLIYYKLGASPQADPGKPHDNISDFPGNKSNDFQTNGEMYSSGVTETLRLTIGIVDHKLQWKFEDEPHFLTLDNWPVIYAIYRQRGYNLTVEKTVVGETGYQEPFTVKITSNSIVRSSYSVDGLADTSIEATPPANGQPGFITFPVRDGDHVTVKGLAFGDDYTVQETGNDNYILTTALADATNNSSPISSASFDSATSTVSFTLSKNSKLTLTNSAKNICRIGSRKFKTLSAAIAYISEQSSQLTETIEMLVDYKMPASDTPEIPASLHVILTSAPKEDALIDPEIQYAGEQAVISRWFADGPMFTNWGELTLGDVTLDGVSNDYPQNSSAMIENDGTLNIGADERTVQVPTEDPNNPGHQLEINGVPQYESATMPNIPILCNAKTSGNGAAVHNWQGDVHVDNGVIENCQAVLGGAIYSSGGTVTVGASESATYSATIQDSQAKQGGAIYYEGSGKVTVQAGTIGGDGHQNTAENGGAIYMASGTCDVLGGSITYNQANGSITNEAVTGCGGAIYALNAYVNVKDGNITHNTATVNGGAVHMETLTLTVEGGALDYNTAATGGAVWADTGSVVLSGGSISNNIATGEVTVPAGVSMVTGCGGGVYSNASNFSMSSGVIEKNTAVSHGGGVYVDTGSVTVEKAEGATAPSITDNTAGYSTDNSKHGNGGGIYAKSGRVTMTKAELTKNAAKWTSAESGGTTTYTDGLGGALYVGSGAVTLTGCTFGGSNANANTALNGAAVFTDTGAVTFKDGQVTYNTAEKGGAVGVGTDNAKLYFAKKIVIRYNQGKVNGSYVASNVYLDKDTDTIINTVTNTEDMLDSNQNSNGVDNTGAYIGIYVPDLDVVVDGETVNLFDRRGVPGARFGTYADSNKVDPAFRNDRFPYSDYDNNTRLKVKTDTSAKKLYWSKTIQVETRYIDKFTNALPNGSNGNKAPNTNKNPTWYNPPASSCSISEIADDVKALSDFKESLKNYVFGVALVTGYNGSPTVSYADYITDVYWNTENNGSVWECLKRDGTKLQFDSNHNSAKLVLYYSDPYYLTIENNHSETLTFDGITASISGNTAGWPLQVINSTSQAGYGYVYAVNGAVQDTLRPVSEKVLDDLRKDSEKVYPAGTDHSTLTTLTLKQGESVKLLFPGGAGVFFKLEGHYETATPVDYTMLVPGLNSDNPWTGTTAPDSTFHFTLEGVNNGVQFKTPSGDNKGKTSELIFGGAKAICRIVAPTSVNVAQNNSNYERRDENSDGKYEYIFSSLNQAVSFITANNLSGSPIEMLVDYMIPASDKVNLPSGYDIIFDTAYGGKNHYPGGDTVPAAGEKPSVRATISRGTGNGGSFITSTAGTFDTLTVRNLIFDGKNYAGGVNKGVVATLDWNLVVDNCEFNNCIANDGGGIYVDFTNDIANNAANYDKRGGSLHVLNTNFNTCKSTGTSRQGGGAIWTDTKDLLVQNCTFKNCEGTDQGGAVFHRIDTTKGNNANYTPHNYASESKAKFENCSLQLCSSRSGGGIETDAHNAEFDDCHFIDCYSVQTSRGFGSGGAINTYIYEGSGSSLVGYASLTVRNCTFQHCTATKTNGTGNGNGGAIRSCSATTIIEGCTFTDCRAIRNGGAIAINSSGSSATISGCTITDCATETGLGGAIYCDALDFTMGEYTFVNGASAGTTIKDCSAADNGGAVYHNRSANNTQLTVTGALIENCKANVTKGSNGGGGIYTNAKTVSMTDSTIKSCDTPKQGGGVLTVESTTVELNNINLLSNTAGLNGGGIYAAAGTSLTVTGCKPTAAGEAGGINGNESKNSSDNNVGGGGIYTTAPKVILRDSELTENRAAGSGGGIFKSNSNEELIIDGSTIAKNIAGHYNSGTAVGKGAGVYCNSNVTLIGLQWVKRDSAGNETTDNRSQVVVKENRLTTNDPQNTAGFWLHNDRTISLRCCDPESSLEAAGVTPGPNDTVNALIWIEDNRTVDGKQSDLRLPDNGTTNKNNVRAYCGVDGRIRVVNARKKLTVFGTMDASNTNLRGFTDSFKVFWSDEGTAEELFGIIHREDRLLTAADGNKRIIWGGDPICKITDPNGRLMYLDPNHEVEAVFDMLDDGLTNSKSSAFGVLRNNVTLYYFPPGSSTVVPYTGRDYSVRMLVENYTAEKPITVGGTATIEENGIQTTVGKNITLTTAKSNNTLWPYRGTRSPNAAVTRADTMDGSRAFITIQESNNAVANFTLQNITLDGGSENGVNATANTRMICANKSGVTVTLSRSASIQNATLSTGNGAGVYLNSGARLVIDGGIIRNCKTENGDGGGVYIDGKDGTMIMNAGMITNCSASGNGGGVFFNKGQLTKGQNDELISGYMQITGGTIVRCSAANGGGVYLNGGNYMTEMVNGKTERLTRQLFMSGGSINGNSATQKGGGIGMGAASGNERPRIYFSGTPFVYNNTSDTAAAGPGTNIMASYAGASNVELDSTLSFIPTKENNNLPKNPCTVIVSQGLNRGASIGVYVPGNDSNGDLYYNHGAEMDPFASFVGSSSGMQYFVNDRNGMKGGSCYDVGNPNYINGDQKIYWRVIYSLTLTKEVLTDVETDINRNKMYTFKVTLSGAATSSVANVSWGEDPQNIARLQFGDMTFYNGTATVGLKAGETIVADLLPLGWSYKIVEVLDPNEANLFKTSAKYWNAKSGTPTYRNEVTVPTQVSSNGTERTLYVENSTAMTEAGHYSYNVTFYNIRAVCKITDPEKGLLYVKKDGKYLAAVYSRLVTAFNQVTQSDNITWYIYENGEYKEYTPTQYRIEMLIDDYEMTPNESSQNEAVSVMGGKDVVLTTASRNPNDDYPYVGTLDTAVIKRHYNGSESMISVKGNGSKLTLENITLDGGSNGGFESTPSAKGAIVNVGSGATLTVCPVADRGEHVTLQNSKTRGDGAAVYLAEGATMNISGGPVFTDNVKTNANLGTNPLNGGDSSFYTGNNAPQDIFIAGYEGNIGTIANSLVVTGQITSGVSSIAVWAEKSPHYIQNQQFALIKDGVDPANLGLTAFRNAQTDNNTQNPLAGDPQYLYGIARDGKVYWSGGIDLTVSKTVTSIPGITEDPNQEFTFTVSGLNNGYCRNTGCDYVIYTRDGTTWTIGESGKKIATGTDYSFTFALKHNQKIVISIPRGLTATVTETVPTVPTEYDTPSYQVNGGTVTTGNSTSSLSMSMDTDVSFTNIRKTKTVTVTKVLDDRQATNAVTFHFTALLKYNNAGIPGYTLNNSGTAIVTETGTNAGQAAFTLSPTKTNSASIVLTVPYGTELTVTEDTTQLIGGKTVAYLYDTTNDKTSGIISTYTFDSVTSDQTLTFTNTRRGADLTVIKTVSGDFADPTLPFTFTIDGLHSGESYTYKKYSTADNGTNWSVISGAEGTGTLTASANTTSATFTLTHNQKIVIEALPINEWITLTEAHGYYIVTVPSSTPANMSNYTTDTGATTVNGAKFQLTGNAELTVTNTMNAASPTGVSFRVAPFALMMAFGLLLFLAGKRRRNEAD